MANVSIQSIEDLWNSPLVKEHFTKVRNFAYCKFCKRRFPLYSGEYVTLEHHVQAKHRLQYHQFQNAYVLKTPMKTYSQASLNKKCQSNSDGARTKKDKTFEALKIRKPSPEPYNYMYCRIAQDSSSLSQYNPCDICKTGTCIPHKVVEFFKETDDVNKNNSVCSGKKLGPEELNNAKSFIDIYTSNPDDGLEEILPDPQPKEVNIIEVKKEPIRESIPKPIQEPIQESILKPIPKPIQEPIRKPIQEPIHDKMENVINSCQTVAVVRHSKPTFQRTYARYKERFVSRKPLQLSENQGSSSSKETDFPSGCTSMSCVETVLQDLPESNSEMIQKDYDDMLPCVNISRLSEDGSIDFRLCHNQESILPDPDLTQLVKPKKEPPDTYEIQCSTGRIM